ncbi:MAG: peptide chain release factor N(5)-glutamine methyltransferase [Bacteroidales bacterium]|nr:peptide chain release factor N(5)-glutamine methyltransferase [Bacteroidales bacterium]
MEIPTISSVRRYMKEYLSSSYPPGELDAIISIILGFLSGKNRIFLLANPGHKLSSLSWNKVNKICIELKNKVPVQYITGETWFYGLKLKVTTDTLIPRQETEELADLVIRENNKPFLKILDIGTGSGCIAVSLAVHMERVTVDATDISAGALKTASLNATNNNASISFIHDDILSPERSLYGSYDIIVCNPPYVTESEKSGMSSNVTGYEPHTALFVPDNNALVYYKAVVELCNTVLKKGGKIYFEINENKSDEVQKLLLSYGYSGIATVKDINGKPRICKGIKT